MAIRTLLKHTVTSGASMPARNAVFATSVSALTNIESGGGVGSSQGSVLICVNICNRATLDSRSANGLYLYLHVSPCQVHALTARRVGRAAGGSKTINIERIIVVNILSMP